MHVYSASGTQYSMDGWKLEQPQTAEAALPWEDSCCRCRCRCRDGILLLYHHHVFVIALLLSGQIELCPGQTLELMGRREFSNWENEGGLMTRILVCQKGLIEPQQEDSVVCVPVLLSTILLYHKHTDTHTLCT